MLRLYFMSEIWRRWSLSSRPDFQERKRVCPCIVLTYWRWDLIPRSRLVGRRYIFIYFFLVCGEHLAYINDGLPEFVTAPRTWTRFLSVARLKHLVYIINTDGMSRSIHTLTPSHCVSCNKASSNIVSFRDNCYNNYKRVHLFLYYLTLFCDTFSSIVPLQDDLSSGTTPSPRRQRFPRTTK